MVRRYKVYRGVAVRKVLRGAVRTCKVFAAEPWNVRFFTDAFYMQSVAFARGLGFLVAWIGRKRNQPAEGMPEILLPVYCGQLV